MPTSEPEVDSEYRAHRFLEAMQGITGLINHSPPDTDINAEGLGCILSILTDEARRAFPQPRGRPYAVND